jgi:hypothetical protein
MEKAQNLANDRYKELCAQFGDLTIRLQGMQKDLENLLKQIDALNERPSLTPARRTDLAQIKADQASLRRLPWRRTPRPSRSSLKGITNLVDDPRGPKK